MVRSTNQSRFAPEAAVGQQPPSRQEYRPLTELFRELRDETTDLVRNEVKLARIEISEKVARVGRNSAYAAAGGVIATAALVILMFAATAGVYVALVEAADMDNLTAGWLAPLIVGGVGAVVGYALMHKGVDTIASEGVIPERTADSLRQDRDWLERKVG